MNIESKTAIVTGASSGLGKSFSRALIQQGAAVYGLARNEDSLNTVMEELGNRFIPVLMDVTDHDAIENWVNQTFKASAQPDILINNAGLGLFANADQLSIEEWHALMETNVSGTFYMCRNIIPLMKNNEQVCHIINMSSIAGKLGNPQMSGYNASKFAVSGFSESLFKELRYDGIKVTCFYPGSVNTRFFDKVDGADTHSNMMHPDDVATQLIHVLETPDNFLISEIVMRPLNPKQPEEE